MRTNKILNIVMFSNIALGISLAIGVILLIMGVFNANIDISDYTLNTNNLMIIGLLCITMAEVFGLISFFGYIWVVFDGKE